MDRVQGRRAPVRENPRNHLLTKQKPAPMAFGTGFNSVLREGRPSFFAQGKEQLTMTKLPETHAGFKPETREITERLHRLSDDLQEVLQAHGAGPSSAVAIIVLARLMAQTVKARPAHTTRWQRWRDILKIMNEAEWFAEHGCPEGVESEFVAILGYFGTATIEVGLDELLLKILAEGTGAVPTWTGVH